MAWRIELLNETCVDFDSKQQMAGKWPLLLVLIWSLQSEGVIGKSHKEESFRLQQRKIR